jgi:hypothetical protein
LEVFRNFSNNLHRMSGPAVIDDDGVQYWQHGRLHRPDGPAVVTASGAKTYYWKGVFIQPSIWARRDEMSIKEVLEEPNAELRRALVEMRGWEKFLSQSGAVLVHEDKKRQMKLFRVDLPVLNAGERTEFKDEPVVILEVLDGTPQADGTRKKYFLRVPPNLKNCLRAVSWTFGMTPKEYKELEQES